MIAPHTLQLGASPMSYMSRIASAAWYSPRSCIFGTCVGGAVVLASAAPRARCLRRPAAACPPLDVHLAQPLGHFFCQPRNVLLRRGRLIPSGSLSQACWATLAVAEPSKPARQTASTAARKEAQIEPAEHVVHQALRVADLLVARPARRLKPRVRKLLAQHF